MNVVCALRAALTKRRCNTLQGSLVSRQLSSESQDATEEQRQFLKSQLQLAWSGEAVKQGVAHAKKAEYDAALGCYKKVSPSNLQAVRGLLGKEILLS